MPISLLRRAARALTLGVLAAVVLPAAPSFAGTYTWDLAQDFVTNPTPVNPNPDRYGTSDAWTFQQGSAILGPVAPLATADPNFLGLALGAHKGTDTDGDGTRLPYIAKNPTASPVVYSAYGVTFPAGKVVVKPSGTSAVIATFTAPVTGTYSFTGAVARAGQSCGDGVRWSASRLLSTLDSGTLTTGSHAMTIADQALNAGDTVNFSVDSGASGLTGCDETQLDAGATLSDTTAPAPTVDAVSDTTNRTPSLSGTRGTAFGDGAVTVKVYNGSTATGSPVATAAATSNGSTWSTDPLGTSLPDGTYTVEATQVDAAGNTGASAVDRTFRVDNAAPAVTMTSPAAGATSSTRPTFSGVAGTSTGDNATVSVKLYSGTSATGVPVQTLSASRDAQTGAWSAQPGSNLAEATYTAVAQQADSLGNTGTSDPVTFTVDTTAPAVSLSSPPARTGAAAPAIAGTAGHAAGDAGTVAIDVYSGPAVAGSPAQSFTTTVDPQTGAFSGSPSPLADGQYTAVARQDDSAGNHGVSASRTFTVDLTAPVPAPTLTAIASPTTDNTPTFAGTALASGSHDSSTVTVEVYAGTSATGSPVVTYPNTPIVLGQFSVTPLVAIPDGTYTAVAAQSDDVGNVARGAGRTFRIDTTAPAPTIDTPAAEARTNAPQATLAGTAGDATGDDANVTVRVYTGTDTNAAPQQTLSVPHSGATWSTQTATLPDGDYTATVTQSDDTGHSGSASQHFYVDSAAPAITLDTVPTRSTTTAPAFTGVASTAAHDAPTVTVKIYNGGSVSGSPVQTLSGISRDGTTGAWTATPAALTDGTYTARADQADDAGNTGHSADRTFTVDTTGPSLTLTALATPAADRTPALTGTAGTATGDVASVTVKVYSGSAASGSPAQTLTATPGQDGHYSVSPATLADGTWTAQAAQADDLGNTSTSAARTFVVDNAAPSPTLDAPPARIASAHPALTGTGGTATGDATTVSVKFYNGESVTGSPVQTATGNIDPQTGAFTATPGSALADGTYTARADQADDAGNTGHSADRTFTVDTTGPSLTLTALATPAADRTPALTGTAGTATGDVASVTVKVYSGSAASGSPAQTLTATPGQDGHYSVSPATLADGTWTAQAAQADDLGNTSTSAARTFVVDNAAPSPTLDPPVSPTATRTPALHGTGGHASDDAAQVTVRLYAGETASGTPVQTLTGAVDPSTGAWTATPTALADGTYTAQATQADAVGNTGTSPARTFRVDATPKTTLTASLTAVAARLSTVGRSGLLTTRLALNLPARAAIAAVITPSDAQRIHLRAESVGGSDGSRYVVLATKTVTLENGTTTVRLRLGSAARRALRRAHRLTVTYVAAVTAADGTQKTINTRSTLTR